MTKRKQNNGNREYKSDVFSMLMEYPENVLQVYNALNGTDYDDPSLVELQETYRTFSLTMKNDASFILGNSLNVYEHQSTVNGNMSLRLLFYSVDMLKKYVKGENLFGRTSVKIPMPKFAVFYNGANNAPEFQDVKLSDSFLETTDDPMLELKCRVYNINKGNNKELLDKCPVLRDYMIFVDYVRENISKDMETEEAIRLAIKRCISEGILVDFLSTRGNEVEKSMTLDYTFERQRELDRKTEREAGIAIGEERGMTAGIAIGEERGMMAGIAIGEANSIKNLMNNGKNSFEQACALLGISEKDMDTYRKMI